MKRTRTTILLALALLVCAFAPGAVAAQAPDAPPPPGLVLEVVYFPGKPPAYLAVSSATSWGERAWYALFARVPSWQPPPGFTPVRAVNIVPREEGGRVRVNVELLTNETPHDKGVPVTSLLIAENERVVVRQLENFGVVPFTLAVVRRSAAPVAPPAVVNKTRSVEVVSEPDEAKPGGLKLKLRNLSDKSVVGLQVEEFRGGGAATTAVPRGREGRALIEPGGVYEFRLSGKGGSVTPDGYIPDDPESVLVAGAVFSDGSYEGKAEVAATVKAFNAGNKLQLARVVQLLRAAAGAADVNSPQAVAALRARAVALDARAEAAVVEELLKVFHDPTPAQREEVRVQVEVSMNGVKKDLLGGLTDFEQARQAAPAQSDFREWLKTRLKRYEQWLARL